MNDPTRWHILTQYTWTRPGARLFPIHGPKVWPWWMFVTVRVVRASVAKESQAAWNIWIYTRWGAWCWGWYPRIQRERNRVRPVRSH